MGSNRICQKCGRPADAGDKFCCYCGGRILQSSSRTAPVSIPGAAKRCRQCGAEIDGDGRFCGNCGAVQKGGTKKITIVIAVAASLIVAIACVSLILACIDDEYLDAPVGGQAQATEENKAVVRESAPSRNKTEQSDDEEEPTEKTVPTKKPQPTEEPQPTEKSESQYLFPSDKEYISDSDLKGKSQDEVRRILNEIYARHGYTFESADNIEYFGSQSWYKAKGKSMEGCEREFNTVENANKDYLVKYEQAHGWR